MKKLTFITLAILICSCAKDAEIEKKSNYLENTTWYYILDTNIMVTESVYEFTTDTLVATMSFYLTREMFDNNFAISTNVIKCKYTLVDNDLDVENETAYHITNYGDSLYLASGINSFKMYKERKVQTLTLPE